MITYNDLKKVLDKMSVGELEMPVQLRDYANQDTFAAIDFLPLCPDSVFGQQFQIGFNE